MRPFATAAALCAAFLTFTSAPRADEDVPEPVSRTVVEPPSQPPPAEAAAVPAPVPAPRGTARGSRGAPSELGFSLRLGSAETDRALLGGSVTAASGPLLVGLSMDGTFATQGGRRYHHDDDHHGVRNWCSVGSDGRCTNRSDLALAALVGLRHKTAPVVGGARLRLELAGELGGQWSYVDERLANGDWSDGSRALPIAGARAQVGLTVFRNATFGIGGYVRQSLAGRVCVTTDGGCTKVGGTTGGVYFFGGGDWAFSG